LDRIRRSLSLAEIFQTTATEARAILGCDRVAMFQFLPESNYAEGAIVSEAVVAPYRSALHQPVIDHCFADRRLDDYLHGRIWSVADIEAVPMADCYRAILQQFEVRANLVVPLLNGTKLWGLFCAHQCGAARTWETTDIDFVRRLADQLSVALQQATLLEKAEAARMVADRANRTKSEFLASMSHELRTPLNAILGLSQLLKAEANLTDRQREWLMTIHQSGEHLLSLISDVLEMSKIEAGKIHIEETCFELSSALEELLDLMAVKTLSKNVTLSYQPAPNLPRFVQTDRKKLSQILLNLLSNAIKFTEQGKVTLRVQQETTSGQTDCWLAFTVEDTGIGIPAENLDIIFQPFERGGPLVQKYEGTGLGLAIVRRFVELMDGQLTVQSQPGRGTTFGFRIRVKTPSRLPDPGSSSLLALTKPDSPPQPWVRVLVVEDNGTNREVLQSMLTTLGYRCDVVASGQAALQQLATQSYEMVLMDVQMPEMDGLQTTRHIYETLPVERQPLVIAVTAGVQVAITKGSEPERLLGLVAGEPHGTVFAPDPQPLNARKRWLAYGAMPVGTLWLDRGAVVAVRDRGRSLLPVGIVAIEGEFEAGDAVRLGDRETGQEVARGLVNYGSPELRQILGHPSTAIATILGVEGEPTAVHRDNLVVLPSIGSDTVDSG
jgi:signal transduction histidine kinase/CheY-like chemotaxis protein